METKYVPGMRAGIANAETVAELRGSSGSGCAILRDRPPVLASIMYWFVLASNMYCFVLWGGRLRTFARHLRERSRRVARPLREQQCLLAMPAGNACWQCLLAMHAGRYVGSLAARRLGSLAVFGFVFGFRVRVRVFRERVFGLVFVCSGWRCRGERVFGCVPVFAVFRVCFTMVFGSGRFSLSICSVFA